MYFTKAASLALLGLSAVAMAAPAPQVDVNGDGKIDKILFEVTSESEATSTVEVPLGGNVVLEETATAIAATSVVVADVGRAICTISTAEAEASVTDVIKVGWKKVFSSTSSATAKAQSISCDYTEEDKPRYGHRNDWYWKKHGHGGHGGKHSGWGWGHN